MLMVDCVADREVKMLKMRFIKHICVMDGMDWMGPRGAKTQKQYSVHFIYLPSILLQFIYNTYVGRSVGSVTT